MCVLRSCFLPKAHFCTCSQSQVTGSINHEVSYEARGGLNCSRSVCGTQVTSPSAFAWSLRSGRLSSFRGLLALLLVRTDFSCFTQLQLSESFVGKEIISLPKKKPDFLTSPTHGLKVLFSIPGGTTLHCPSRSCAAV